MNCRLWLTVRLPGAAGVTAIEFSVGAAATTVRGTLLLVISDRVAVILVAPAATPVAKPLPLIVAAAVLELFQVTWVVMSAVELSV